MSMSSWRSCGHDEDVADVDDAVVLEEAWIARVLKERVAHHLRTHVGAAKEARAHVRRHAEHDRLGRGDALEPARKESLDLVVGAHAVEAMLHRALLREPGRDDVEATRRGAQHGRELFDRGEGRGHAR